MASVRRFCTLLAIVVIVVLADPNQAAVPDPRPKAVIPIKFLSQMTAIRLKPRPGSEGPTWADDAVEARFNALVTYVRKRDLATAVVTYLLDMGRKVLDRYKEYVFVAIHLWARLPERLRDQGGLLLQLLAQTRCCFDGKHDLLRRIARSVSSEALSATDAEGRTPLQYYLSFKFHDINLDVAAAFALKTPKPVLIRIHTETLDRLPPHIWCRVFYQHNTALIIQMGNRSAFNQNVFGAKADRTRWETAVVLARLARIPTRSVNEIARALDGVELTQLLTDCAGHFNYFVHDHDLHALWNLSGLYNQTELRDLFCQQVPYMFASMRSSFAAIVHFINATIMSGNCNDEWRLRILRRLTVFHLNHDLMVGYLLAQHYRNNARYLLIEYITLNISKQFKLNVCSSEQRNLDHCQYSIIRTALRVCSSVREQPAVRLWSSLLLNLTLRAILSHQNSEFIISCRFPVLHAEQLRKAFLMVSMMPNFHSIMNRTIGQNKRPLLYQIRNLLPEKTIQMADHHKECSLGKRRLPLRIGSHPSQDYRFIEPLGDGSFGTVYRAVALKLPGNPEVAVKVMPSKDPNTNREVAFMSRYSHSGQIPGLVQVLDLVQYGPDTYAIMELIKGQTLQGRDIPTDATEAAQQLIHGLYGALTVLHQLHQIGWNHGDIQHLNNFMIKTADQSVVVLDFGFTHRLNLADYPVACNNDLDQIYEKFVLELDTVKERVGTAWYETSPGLLGQFETALRSWPSKTWNCVNLLRDPIFDHVRGPATSSQTKSDAATPPNRSVKGPDFLKGQNQENGSLNNVTNAIRSGHSNSSPESPEVDTLTIDNGYMNEYEEREHIHNIIDQGQSQPIPDSNGQHSSKYVIISLSIIAVLSILSILSIFYYCRHRYSQSRHHTKAESPTMSSPVDIA